MNFNTYQSKARETAIYPAWCKYTYPVLGLNGEAGEIAEKLKKMYRDSEGEMTPDIKEDIVSEMGDCLWYLSALATELGVELEYVATKNVLKLEMRKRQGKIKGSGDKR